MTNTPRNLTQLKKFFAAGMELRVLAPDKEPVVLPVCTVQRNAITLTLESGSRTWILWDKPAKEYIFTDKGFSYALTDGKRMEFEYVTLEKPEVIPTPKVEKSNPNLFVGPDAAEQAARKARFGRKDWVVYTDRSGQRIAEKLTSASVKRALLATGTQGRFVEIAASSAHRYSYCWSTGINRLNNARYVEKHGPLW